MEALRLHFKPEFLNRVDDILIFHRLTKEQLRVIVTLQMARLRPNSWPTGSSTWN